MKFDRAFRWSIVAFAALIAATSHSELGESRILRIGNAGEPQTLDPHRYNLNLEEHILKDLFLGLTTMNAGGEIVPGSAKSWTISDDGLTWTFELAQNRWSDGELVDAYDFEYSLRRVLDPETAASLAFFLYCIENGQHVNTGNKPTTELGVKAVDVNTLEIRLEKPFPYFAERLFYPTGSPVPSHVIEKVGADWVKPQHWVSNGPYKLREWIPQAHVELAKNDFFLDSQTRDSMIDTVRYYPVADPLTGYHRFLAGELDIVGDFPVGELRTLRADHADKVHVSPLLSIMYLVFNVNHSPFDDVRVRKALALAVDRDLLTKRVLQSGERPNASFVPSLVAGYDSTIMESGVNLDLAKELLNDVGYSEDNRLQLTLRYFAGSENKKVHVALAGMWERLGVETTLHHTELKVHFTDLRNGDFEIAQAGWFGENNPEHYLELLWSDIGAVNYGGYSSEVVDAIIESAKETADASARAQILKHAEQAALNDYPVIPLYSVMIRSLVDPDISGWQTNPRNSHGVRYMSFR